MASARTQSQQAKARQAAQPQKGASRRTKSFWTRTRVGVGLAVALVALVVALATLSSGVRMRPHDPLLDAEFQAVDGQPFRLSDYEGKLLVVNLWATWCGPCRMEIPHLVQVAKDYKARGVEVVGLTNEDPKAARDKARDFARDLGIDYRLGFIDRQSASLLMDRDPQPQRRSDRIPQVFIMRDGRVLEHLNGFNPQSGEQRLRAAIDRALQEK